MLVDPVKELDELRIPGAEVKQADLSVSGEKTVELDSLRLACSEINVEFQKADRLPQSFGLILSNDQNEQLRIGYSSEKKQLFVDRSKAGKNDFSPKFEGVATAPLEMSETMNLHIYVDVASVEVFADDGQLVMTETYFPTSEMNHLELFADSGNVAVNNITVRGLKSIW